MTGCAKDMYKYRLLIFHGQTDLLPEDHIKLSGLATSATCERNKCAFDTPRMSRDWLPTKSFAENAEFHG